MSRLTYLSISAFVTFLFSQTELSAQSQIKKVADDHIIITINKSDIEEALNSALIQWR